MSSLRADFYVALPIPWKKPNGSAGGLWSPISCTLIHSDKEAVLVDTLITISQAKDLGDWIEKVIPKKKLTTIYITHGHGDHFFGIPQLLKRFPGARAVETATTVKHISTAISNYPIHFPQAMSSTWRALAKAIEVGQADTNDSTVLWVPDIKLAVCGDVVYGDVHQMLGECDTKEKRLGWISSVHKVQALKPELVVPGHKRASEMDGTYHLANTIRYIETFEELLEGGAKDARELSQAMLKKVPARFSAGALIVGCVNAFKKASANL